jgi:hypothetical protein
VRVAAEAGDVVVHPVQRGELIEQPPIVGCAVETGESFESGSVVGADHDGAGTSQGLAVEVWVGRVAV